MASLIRRNNGVYYAIVTKGKKREWNSLYTKDESEARSIYEQSFARTPRGTHKRLSGIKDAVCAYVRINLSPETWKMYVHVLELFEQYIGNVAVKLLKASHFEEFKEQRLESGVKRVTININLRTLRAAFTKAFELELIDSNPARYIKLFKIPRGEPEFLTQEEFASLLTYCTDKMLQELLITAALTGMRRGELVNLHWEDLNFERDTIRIRNRDTFMVKGNQPRTIPLHPALLKMFQKRRELTGPIFIDSTGRQCKPHKITRVFKALARKAQLPKGIHFHSLRHTTASWLVQKGVPIYDVNSILGHRSITTTQIYAHLENNSLKESIQMIDTPSILRRAG